VLSKQEQYLAANVRAAMAEKELSLRTLSEQTGIPYKTIHTLLIQKSSPRVATLVSLSEALGISIDDLLAKPVRRAKAIA